MIDFMVYILAIFGAAFWLFVAVAFISHMLDRKAKHDHERKIEEAKDRALTKPSWWPIQND